MDNSSDEFHISFFKPTTPQAKANRDMVVWLVLIWFIAIFGFQILLRIIEKPTPEPAHITFENLWGGVEQGSPNAEQLQQLGQTTLSVLGKMSIAPNDKQVLDNALSWSVYQLTSESSRNGLLEEIKAFENMKAEIEDISDPAYNAAKRTISADIGPLLKLSNMDVRTKILPLELSASAMANLSDETIKSLPGVMKKYLIHNQSFLTDMKILGFPFHYFYTATFLLILFVGLCWLYCVKTDRMNAELNIID